jgi:Spy/CpxP family protein refolding chaperone
VNSWKVILATMVIFGTGVVTGGLLVHYSEGIHSPRSSKGPGMARPGQFPSAGLLRFEFLRRAGRDLDLTPEQKDQLDKIIKDSQERAKRVTAPFLREEVQRTKAEFREVLTPEQRTKFDELLKHQQQQQQQQRSREQRHPATPGERPPEATTSEPKK